MARGGSRPGAGRPKGKQPKWFPKDNFEPSLPQTKEEIKDAAANADMSPLDFMLKHMRDEAQPLEFRARMAVSAAPFVYGRAGEKGGKKGEKDEAAKKAASGRFASAPGPKVVPIHSITKA